MKPKVRDTIDFRLQGIPCQIGVYYFKRYKGSFDYNAASDFDYYGYCDFDYELLDNSGHRAEWLSRKVTNKDERDIETAICEYFD